MATRASTPERLGGMNAKKLHKYAEDFSNLSHKMGATRMTNATAYNNFETDGGNKWAIKVAMRLGKMDPAKAHTDFMDLKGYVEELYPEIAADMFTPKSEQMGEKQTLDPFVQGKAAGQAGINFADNPFTAKSEDGTAWSNGWKAGQEVLINAKLGSGTKKESESIKQPEIVH